MRRNLIFIIVIVFLTTTIIQAGTSEVKERKIGVGFQSAPFPIFGISGIYKLNDKFNLQLFGRIGFVDVDLLAVRGIYRIKNQETYNIYVAGLLGIFHDDSVSQTIFSEKEADTALGFGISGGVEFFIKSLEDIGFNLEVGLVHIGFKDIWWVYDYQAPTLIMIGLGFHYYF